MHWYSGIELVLASGSPRRKQLLEEMNIPFRILTTDLEETYPDELPIRQIPLFLANKKAEAVRNAFDLRNEIVLGADSVVILNERVLGKPADAREAYRMLASLSGKAHDVITGVCLLREDRIMEFSSTSKVLMRDLDHHEITYYVDRFNPLDKAGAYAIQEWIGRCKISGIEGSYTNIMGLPTDLVYEALKQISRSG